MFVFHDILTVLDWGSTGAWKEEDNKSTTLQNPKVSHIFVIIEPTQTHIACKGCIKKCEKDKGKIKRGVLVQVAMLIKYQAGLKRGATYKKIN